MKRARLPDSVRRSVLERQGGLCASWGCQSEGPFEADHIQPLSLGGDNGADNWQLLCRACHKRKSFGLRGDISSNAKAKRISEGRTQYDKRAQHGPQIKGRGFQGWRGLDGSIRWRGK